jgi:PIN like domain
MRTSFREWYPLTAEEIQRLWTEAMIVFDSSVLLGLYQYPAATLEVFVGVLDRIHDRTWIPHQVGLEFHRNREGRIPERRQVLDRLIREVDQLDGTVERLTWPDYHPVLDVSTTEARRQAIRESIGMLSEHLKAARDATPEPGEKDEIWEQITQKFAGRVGPPFTSEALAQIAAEGVRRYAKEIPPGYKDRDKDEDRRYNDLIVWKQILVQATGSDGRPARPTILVTNDRKDDWWRRRQEKVVAPRTELIREYLDVVGEYFFMYTPDQFLEDARTYLSVSVSSQTIVDVQRVSQSSPVVHALRGQRMVLPDHWVRSAALGRLYDALHSGLIPTVAVLNDKIERLGVDFADRNVSVPLFFSLISEAYGPIRVEANDSQRLRDRSIVAVHGLDTRETFLEVAETAWLAQALYRLRYDRFREDDLLTGFFGDNPPSNAPTLLSRAQELVQVDYASQGLRPE